jgi:hypothetical protein
MGIGSLESEGDLEQWVKRLLQRLGVPIGAPSNAPALVPLLALDGVTAIAANATVQLTGGKVFDLLGAYNAATGVYTIPTAGFYGLIGHVEHINAAANTDAQVWYSIGAGGTQRIARVWNNVAGAEAAAAGYVTMSRAAQDQLKFWASNDDGSATRSPKWRFLLFQIKGVV